MQMANKGTIHQRIGKSSLIYTAATLLQRGASFLLLPLYTRVLTPDDFGILSVVIGLNGLLSIFYTFSLHGAVTRFYIEYKDEPKTRSVVVGTIISSVICISLFMAVLSFFIGARYFSTLPGGIPFFPYVALGVVATVFQPIYLVCLNLFQIKEEPFKYALMSFSYFIVNVTLIIYFVVMQDMGAEGPLWALLLVSVIFAIYSLYHFRKEFYWTIDFSHLRKALKYSVPIISHNISGQFQAFFDRFLLVALIGTTVTGQYHVGFLVGSLIAILTESVNKAFVPVALAALKDDIQTAYDQIKDIGSVMSIIFALAAAFISLFADEILYVVSSSAYAGSADVIPLIAFSFAFGGVYYIFVNIFFYNLRAVKYLSIFTFASLMLNVSLNYILIPKYSMIGAGVSALSAQMLISFLVAYFGKKYEKINWRYGSIFSSLIISLIIVFMLRPIISELEFISATIAKVSIIIFLYFLLNLIHWKRFNHLYYNVKGFL